VLQQARVDVSSTLTSAVLQERAGETFGDALDRLVGIGKAADAHEILLALQAARS